MQTNHITKIGVHHSNLTCISLSLVDFIGDAWYSRAPVVVADISIHYQSHWVLSVCWVLVKCPSGGTRRTLDTRGNGGALWRHLTMTPCRFWQWYHSELIIKSYDITMMSSNTTSVLLYPKCNVFLRGKLYITELVFYFCIHVFTV